MKYLYILLFIFLSACEPGYSVAYKINLENDMEETKITDIKNSLIKEGNLTKAKDVATQEEYQSKSNGYNVYDLCVLRFKIHLHRKHIQNITLQLPC